MADRAFPDPRSCALAGYSPRSGAQAVAYAEDGDFAVVLVVTPDLGGYEYLVNCVHDVDGWSDTAASSGAEHWLLSDEDRELGWLAGWGQADTGTRWVRVEYAGQSAEAPVGPDGYFVWLLVDVPCPDVPVDVVPVL